MKNRRDWYVSALPLIVAASIATILLVPTALAQSQLHFHELVDINQTRDEIQRDPSIIYNFFEFGDRLFFIERDVLSGVACWSTDGTAAGTSRFLGSKIEGPFFPVGNQFCSIGRTTATVTAIWCSDGTLAGTRPVYETQEIVFYEVRPHPVGDITYLVVRHARYGAFSIWRTDGTADGTWIAAALEPELYLDPADTFVFDGSLYFCSQGPGFYEKDLWVSDGTPAGTHVLVPYTAGAPGLCTAIGRGAHVGPHILGDRIVFTCDETWRLTSWPSDLCAASSPTEGIEIIARDIRPALPTLDEDHGQVYFWGRDDTGDQVWRTDGTAAGVTRLTSIPEDYESFSIARNETAFATNGPPYLLNGSYLFRVRPPPASPSDPTPPVQLWIAHGVTNSVEKLLDNGRVLAVAGRRAFIRTPPYSEPGETDQVWISDGTPAGTLPMMEGLHISVHWAALGDRLVFRGFGPAQPDDYELWISDGTAASTHLLKEMRVDNRDSHPDHFKQIGDRAVFLADDGVHGVEPWITDGTSAGTYLLGDTNPEPGDPLLLPKRLDDGLIGCGTGGRLWVVHGDPLRAERVSVDVSCQRRPVMLGRQHYFVSSGTDATTGDRGIWMTDGTAAGTRPVVTFSGSPIIQIGQPVVALDRIFFHVSDSGLWRSDGTEEGTEQVFASTNLSLRSMLGEVAGSLLFIGADGEYGDELWASDGSEDGTFLVRDINPGTGGMYGWDSDEWAIIGDRLYLSAYDPEHGWEPWVSDGTTEGTRLLADLGFPNDSGPGSHPSSSPSHFVPVGDRVAFITSGLSPNMFVTTDGTPEGTRVEWQERDGTNLWVRTMFVPFRGKLLFWRDGNADLGVRNGVWETDGTVRGTHWVGGDTRERIRFWSQWDNGWWRRNYALAASDRLVLTGTLRSSGVELWVAEPTPPRRPSSRVP